MVSSVDLYGAQGVNYNTLYSKSQDGVDAGSLFENQGLTSLFSINNIGKNIMPESKKTVTIDGETYEVVKVQDNDSKIKSYAPMYKEVVIIDGKQYDVQQVPNMNGCDMTKEVVVIDGKQYDVKDGNNFDILY